MDATVQVWLGERGAHGARLDLLLLDVSPGDSAVVPDASRGLDAATVSTLAVAVLGSGELTAPLASVREWPGRGNAAPRTVRLVDLFLTRHDTQRSP